MKRKIMIALAAGMCFQTFPAMAADVYQRGTVETDTTGPGFPKWTEDANGWWYRNTDGTYPAAQWMDIDGVRYHFNDQGYMDIGWYEEGDNRYYLKEDGSLAKDETITLENQDYEFNGEGICITELTGLRYNPLAQNYIPETDKSDIHHAADQIADQILASITTPDMTETEKARAIYAWVRGSLSYGGASATRDWPTEAYQGMRRRRGDCFTYYATAAELLSRAGIASMRVIRSTDEHHFWNLVFVDGAWYHFDTCPRAVGGYYCLWTDAQMIAFSRAHGGCFAFDRSLYPATP